MTIINNVVTQIAILIIISIHPTYMAVKEYKRSSIVIKACIRTWGWEGRTYGGRRDAFSDAFLSYTVFLGIDAFVFVVIVECVKWLSK